MTAQTFATRLTTDTDPPIAICRNSSDAKRALLQARVSRPEYVWTLKRKGYDYYVYAEAKRCARCRTALVAKTMTLDEKSVCGPCFEKAQPEPVPAAYQSFYAGYDPTGEEPDMGPAFDAKLDCTDETIDVEWHEQGMWTSYSLTEARNLMGVLAEALAAYDEYAAYQRRHPAAKQEAA